MEEREIIMQEAIELYGNSNTTISFDEWLEINNLIN